MEELLGCWREAQRADKVSAELVRIRLTLGLDFYDEITIVILEIESSSRLLRDLYDLFPIYNARVPIIVYYLNVVLPTLCKTLRDMTIYVDNPTLPARDAWVLMIDRMGDQGGMTLAARHVMYNEFLVQLIRLLSRSPLYDPTMLESLRKQHMRLRLFQGINTLLPPNAQQHLATPQPSQAEIQRRHWAEKVFEDQPRSATGLRHRRTSRCFGPIMVEERLGIPSGSVVLFKLPFDKNRLSVTLYLHADGADVTRLLCRWIDKYYNPLYSCYGVHELCVRRKGSSLQFRRWSNNKAHSTLWMALFFKTWEKMVLFHASFVALKARCPLTVTVDQGDCKLAGERRIFQGKIIDDDFHHSLAVYQDEKSHGLRLLASVWSGELAKCPVWTAFVTHQWDDPEWLERRSRHRIWLKDIRPHVLCKDYKKRHQIKRNGRFELNFIDAKTADSFEYIFRSVPPDARGAAGHDLRDGGSLTLPASKEETELGSTMLVPVGKQFQ